MSDELDPELVWIKMTDQWPPLGRLVYTRDENGFVSAYTRYEHGFNSLIDDKNTAIIEWLDVQLPALYGFTKRIN